MVSSTDDVLRMLHFIKYVLTEVVEGITLDPVGRSLFHISATHCSHGRAAYHSKYIMLAYLHIRNLNLWLI